MNLKVKDNKGEVYTMPSETPKCILEVHYSTSYYEFVVQDYFIDDDGKNKFPSKSIIVPINSDNWVDFIAVKDDQYGEIMEGCK